MDLMLMKYQYHHVSCGEASIGESMEKLADHPLERKPTVDTRLRTRVVPAFRSFYMLFTTLLAQKSLKRPKNVGNDDHPKLICLRHGVDRRAPDWHG